MSDVMREVTLEDLDAIEIGAAILGTGGGGNPYIGKLRCREELRKGRKIPIIPLDELPDDALVVSLGGIGAPVVGVEKIEEGEECLRALRAVEQEVGRKVDALISAEIGGANSMEPMLTIADGQPGAGGYREHDILVITENGNENITGYPYGPENNIVG